MRGQLSGTPPLRSQVVEPRLSTGATTARRRFPGATPSSTNCTCKGYTQCIPPCPRPGAASTWGSPCRPVIASPEVDRRDGGRAAALPVLRRASSSCSSADSRITGATTRSPGSRRRTNMRSRDAGGGIQDHGQGAARGGDRGHPRRGVQPHRRGQRGRAGAQPQGDRQLGLLPADAGQAALRERHRLRQHRQLRTPAGARAHHRLPEVLGRGDARRRLPLRSGHGAGARRRRLQRELRRSSRRCAPSRRSRTSS